MLGLPEGTLACLFDLDGVVTKTALVHAAAWKQMFDAFLREYAAETGTEFVPFDPVREYDRYVDGKPRLDGTRSFLQSRGIELPEGSPDDPPGAHTINGLSTRKNALVLEMIDKMGVEVYDGSVRYIRRVREAGLHTAVVSSSANTVQVLNVAGIADLFDARIDGVIAKQRGLAGKPAPTRSWPEPRNWACRRPARRCSRTRWPGSRRAGPGTSASWWALTGQVRRKSWPNMARTSWSRILRSCWTGERDHDQPAAGG